MAALPKALLTILVQLISGKNGLNAFFHPLGLADLENCDYCHNFTNLPYKQTAAHILLQCEGLNDVRNEIWIKMGVKIKCFKKIILISNLVKKAALIILKTRILKQFNYVDVERIIQAIEDVPPPKGKNPKTADAIYKLRKNE